MDVRLERLVNLFKGKQLKKGCKHSWTQTGFWDGSDKDNKLISGPILTCLICEDKIRPRWEEAKSGKLGEIKFLT